MQKRLQDIAKGSAELVPRGEASSAPVNGSAAAEDEEEGGRAGKGAYGGGNSALLEAHLIEDDWEGAQGRGSGNGTPPLR